MNDIRVIIAGSRYCPENSEELFIKISKLLSNLGKDNLEIVSGCARGADKLGENFAKMFNIPIKRFPAKWEEHGRSAGPIRNKEMSNYATHLIAFWDGKSRGTKNMIDTATEDNLKVRVIYLK